MALATGLAPDEQQEWAKGAAVGRPGTAIAHVGIVGTLPAMPVGFDRVSFDRALEEFRFADAEGLVADADPEVAAALRSEIGRRRDAAEAAAAIRYQQIVDAKSAGRYDDVLALRDDPTTPPLLELVGDTARRRADVFFGDAEGWAQTQRKTNLRRMADARKALDEFDVDMARGLLRQVGNRFLDADARRLRDDLAAEVASRQSELDALRTAGERVEAESRPPRRRPWWRRR